MSWGEWSPGHIAAGKYSIQSVLGRSERTQTYAALVEPNREVVLRVFAPEFGAAIDEFAQRMPDLAALANPAILRVIEVARDEKTDARFLVTERSRHPSL